MGVIIPRLRKSARGQRCTLRACYACAPDETVVLCHAPGPKSAASKVDDWHSAFGCADCHRVLDQHLLDPGEESRIWLRGIRETQRIWRDMGLIIIVGDNPKPKPPSSKILPRKLMTVQP